MNEFPDPHFKCPNCGEMIDPDTCWCGQPEKEHGYSDNHMFIPMGCNCYREKHNSGVDTTGIL